MVQQLNQGGFTLIELVIVIVVLGILATVAMPTYSDMSIDAKSTACRTSLMNMRSAISVWNSKSITTGAGNVYPPIDTLRKVGSVLVGQIPPNPFQLKTNAPDSVVTGVTKGVIVGTRGGWAYKASTGELWANTGTTTTGSGCSGSVTIGENNW